MRLHHPPASRPRHATRLRHALRAAAATAFALLALSAHATAPLSLDDRVACQTVIDDVRWSQSLWPDVNPGPRPPRADVVSDDAIRAKVIEQFRHEQALFGRYGERIDTAALQAELDRIARDTRAPDQLRELYDALGNDADTIANCLVRPTLAERRLRRRFADDAAIHADVHTRAGKALARGGASVAVEPGMQRHSVTYKRVDPATDDTLAALAPSDADPSQADIALSPDEWDTLLATIDREAARDAKHGTPQWQETDTTVYHRRVLERGADRLVLDVQTWDKLGFDAWWNNEAPQWQASTVPYARPGEENTLTLPTIGGTAASMAKAYGPGDAMPDNTWRTEHTPMGRTGHTSVWTGTEMIVWGGTRNVVLNTGGRFDPVTGTWRPVSTINAPSARELHTAVWTGSEMIVWGGVDGQERFDSGASYDPASDTWTDLPAPGGKLGARDYHSAVWTGSEMIVWGGRADIDPQMPGLERLDTGASYRPETQVWTATPSTGAPSARSRHSAVWTGDRMILWAGYGDNGAFPADGAIYTPGNPQGSWQPTPPNGPVGRTGHTAVWAPEIQTMIVWGGAGNGAQKTGGRLRRSGEQWTWSATFGGIGTPSARVGHAAVWTGSRMLVFGDEVNTSTKGGVYDPVADAWTELALPEPLATEIGNTSEQTAVWTGSQMLLWGGAIQGKRDSRTLIYNPAGQGTWTLVGNADVPLPRYSHTAIWTGTQMIVWGGTDGLGVVRNNGARYDAATGAWLPMPVHVDPRRSHTAVWTGIDMFVWGGYKDATVNMNRGARYNPAIGTAGKWQEDFAKGPPRSDHLAVWAGDRMLVWGGFAYNNTWQSSGLDIKPGAGNQASTGTIFQAPDNRVRAAFSMSWAPQLGELMVWGGHSADGTQVFDDGWRYNPADPGLNSLIVSSGEPRFLHKTVWAGNNLLVIGGQDGAGDLAVDNQSYFPAQKEWTHAGSLAKPRVAHTLVWTGTEALVWGGFDFSGDLQIGERVTPPVAPGQLGNVVPMSSIDAPSARYEHSAVWSPQRLEMLVFGGTSDGTPASNDLGVYSAGGDGEPPALFGDGFE